MATLLRMKALRRVVRAYGFVRACGVVRIYGVVKACGGVVASGLLLAASPSFANGVRPASAVSPVAATTSATAAATTATTAASAATLSTAATPATPATAATVASSGEARAAAARLPALSFANVKVVSRSVVTYRCADGHEMGVAYMNTDNDQSFAVIRLAGQHVVLVSSIAASGVRYIGAHYIWWTKGDEGTLYDQQKGEDAPPVAADCQALKP
jgi:membrane-bound inhibitor of C-type lysozyme